MDDIYGELENGTEFNLTPLWLLKWEEEEKAEFEESKHDCKKFDTKED